ncbi:hypothetical protein BA893_09010 [Vibrio natriegens]|uniref:hypothetical protein n=1 Tax=Vibrio natriegens TaxID=691 RepID=UPI000803EED7|nr:hypothetical protein [Vibrio natriegens]ANQ21802.1 hypothetical protein BA893_09010 [Vibrio natriegens]
MANYADAMNVAIDKKRNNILDDGKNYTPYRHRKGMTLYLRLNIKRCDEEVRNGCPKNKVVIVAKKRIDDIPKYTFEEFLENDVTECVKSGEYNVTKGAYDKFIAKHKSYYKLYYEAKINECRGYFDIDRAGIKKQAAKVSKPVHEVADIVEKLALEGLFTVVEAQDLYQAMYRIKQVLDAYVMPDVLFHNMLFFDRALVERIKNINHLSSVKISSKLNATRFLKHKDKIDCFDQGDKPKKMNSQRKSIESFF